MIFYKIIQNGEWHCYISFNKWKTQKEQNFAEKIFESSFYK
jgi:hypothetical protein